MNPHQPTATPMQPITGHVCAGHGLHNAQQLERPSGNEMRPPGATAARRKPPMGCKEAQRTSVWAYQTLEPAVDTSLRVAMV